MKLRRMAMVAFAILVTVGAVLPHRTVKPRVADLTNDVSRVGKAWDGMPAGIQGVINTIIALATNYASLQETVDAYPGGNAIEDAIKADVTKLRADAVVVKANMEALKAAHAAIKEHGHAAVVAKLAELD